MVIILEKLSNNDQKYEAWTSSPAPAIDALSMFGDRVVRIAPAAAVRMEVGNSVVATTGPISLSEIVSTLFREASIHNMKISLNLIRIDGPMPDEPLHYHLGNILILVTAGAGYLRYEEDGEDKEAAVRALDIIAIPSGALHSFTCDERQSAEYAVLEVGPQIDYQAHHYR